MRFPLHTSHNLIVSSSDPDAKYSPSSENTTVTTEPEWPVRVLISSPFYAFHNPIVQSLDPEAKYSPFLENDTLYISSECTVIFFISWTSLEYNILAASKNFYCPLSFSSFSLSPPSIESSPFLTIILSIS